MELSDAGLHEQPFRASGEPLAVSAYNAHRRALEFLQATYDHRHGLGVLQGPTLSGKSTVLGQFLKTRHPDVSTAVVDARGLTPETLLRTVLDQFGYSIELDTINELLGMLRVVAMQETVSGRPPVLAVENCYYLESPVLRMLCELADLKANRQSAIRLVMACERSVDALINAPELQGIATRVTGIHRMKPMALIETRDYLHSKLYAAGAADPSAVFPADVCVDIHMASGGWPGVVDRHALFVLAKARKTPVTPDLVERRQLPKDMQAGVDNLQPVSAGNGDTDDRPRLLLSKNHELLDDLKLDCPRLLIGRSSHNDLTIKSRFVSRHHALLVSQGRSTLLMDLNSFNGTFVNSRRVSNHVMRHEDVITFGDHSLKFVHPAADYSVSGDGPDVAETVIMKTLEDMRHLLSGESTQTLSLDAVRRLAAGDRH